MSHRFGWALAAAVALAPALAFAAPTPLPYFEDWGNQGIGCGPQWAGPCEAGWASHGAAGSLSIKRNTHYVDLDALLIKPGTLANPNGISRSFTVTPGGRLGLSLQTVGVDGGGKFHVRVRYFNGPGLQVGSENHVLEVPSCSARGFELNLAVPPNGVIAQIFYGASQGTSPTTRLGFGPFGPYPCLWCGLPGHVPDPPPPPPPPDEGTSCPDAQCDECTISCPEGEHVVDTCVNDENCVVIQDCYCADDFSGGGTCDDEFSTQGSWY